MSDDVQVIVSPTTVVVVTPTTPPSGLLEVSQAIVIAEGYRDDTAALRDEVGTMKGQVDTAKQAVDTAKGQVDVAKGAVDVAKQAVDTAKQSVDTTKGQIDTIKGQIDTEKAAVDTAKGQVDTAKAAVDVARAAIDGRIYPGTYAGPPATRPDGSAIQEADRYVSTGGIEYIHLAGTWVDYRADAAASAASALVSKGAADVSQQQASTAATASATAQAASETARDAAQAASRIYATSAAGDAATTAGQYYYVVSASVANTLELWLHNGTGGSDTGKRMPAIGIVNDVLAAIGIALSSVTHETLGATTANTSTVASGSMWSSMGPRANDAYLTGLSVRLSAAGTGKILIVDSTNTVTYDSGVLNAPIAGINSFDISPTLVPAGARVYWLTVTGGWPRFVAGGSSYFVASSDYNGVVGDTVSAPTLSATTFAISTSFSYVAQSHSVALAVNAAAITANATAITANTSRVKDLLAAAGVDLTAVTHETIGATASDTSTADTTKMWSSMAPRATPAWVTQVSVRLSAAGTGRVLVVNSVNVVTSDSGILSGVAGVNSFDVTPALVPAGGRVYWSWISGGNVRWVAGSGQATSSVPIADYNGTVGDGVSAPLVSATVALAMSCSFASVSQSHAAAIASLMTSSALQNSVSSKSVASLFAGANTAGIDAGGTWGPVSPAIQWSELAIDSGADVPVGAMVRAVGARILAATGTGQFRFTVYKRATSNGDIRANPSADAMLSQVTMTPAALGLTVGAAAIADVTVPISPFTLETGYTYHVLVECFALDLVTYANFGVGYAATTDTRQRFRGWYGLANTVQSGGSTVAASVRPIFGLVAATSMLHESIIERVDSAQATIAGLNVTVQGSIQRRNTSMLFSNTQTFTAASAGKVRYDIFYYDMDAGTFGVQVGTERTTDPTEVIPALANSKRQGLFNVRVTDATVTSVVPLWDVVNGECRALAEELEIERRRGRMCLPKTLAKIRKGAALKIASFGHSILAMQAGAAPSDTTPNGASRDLPFFYTQSIASDITDAIPKYTAVQLGRADDGAGAVHIKLGMVWELVNALQATGMTVTYDNISVASRSTVNAVDGSLNPTAWLTAAVALGQDLTIINLAINEPNFDTATETRLVSVINAFKNAGSEVVVMGSERKTAPNLLAWEYVNRAYYRAARYCGVAFIPTMALYDSRYIGAIGCAIEDTCSANQINHPGILEQRAIGRELVKLLMGAA